MAERATILVIDDEEAMRDSCCQVLSKDLDGLMLCGETNADAFNHVRECILEPLNALESPPQLIFRV